MALMLAPIHVDLVYGITTSRKMSSQEAIGMVLTKYVI